MLDELSIPFEEYYNSLQGVKNRNFPIEQLEKMKDYLIEKYEKNLFVIYEDLALLVLNPDSSPTWKGEGSLPRGSSFPPSIRDYISHLVGSRGSQRAPHLKRGDFHCRALVPLTREILDAPPTAPLSPQSSWGGASLTPLKDILTKKYLNIRGLSIPALKGEAFRPLNPLLCKDENRLRIASKETERIMKELGLYNPLLKNNAIIGEYVKNIMNGLQKLVDGLKKNEEEFYKEVLDSGNPNFLITSYYSLYLRFVTTVYLKLRKIAIPNPNIKTKDSTIKDTFTISNFLVGFFGIPILIYIKKKEVLSCISELSGILLHVLVANKTSIPSNDSLGYYLFSKIHVDNS